MLQSCLGRKKNKPCDCSMARVSGTRRCRVFILLHFAAGKTTSRRLGARVPALDSFTSRCIHGFYNHRVNCEQPFTRIKRINARWSYSHSATRYYHAGRDLGLLPSPPLRSHSRGKQPLIKTHSVGAETGKGDGRTSERTSEPTTQKIFTYCQSPASYGSVAHG